MDRCNLKTLRKDLNLLRKTRGLEVAVSSEGSHTHSFTTLVGEVKVLVGWLVGWLVLELGS